MTLILSYLAPEFVLQVSDQLLVVPHPNGYRALPDPAVKAVVLDGRFAFGCTGLAKLPQSQIAQTMRDQPSGEVPANEWLAHVLGSQDSRPVLDRVHEELEGSYARLRPG